MNTPYKPIDCGLHDLLEGAVTKGRPVRVIYRNEQGSLQETTSMLTDVYSKSGEEFLVCASGELIRLDKLVTVDGLSFKDAAAAGTYRTR